MNRGWFVLLLFLRPARMCPGCLFSNPNLFQQMSRSLCSPRLSDEVVRALYHEGRRRGMPMTRLADELLRSSLQNHPETPGHSACQR